VIARGTSTAHRTTSRQQEVHRSALCAGMLSGSFDRPIINRAPQATLNRRRNTRRPMEDKPAFGQQRPEPAFATIAGLPLRRPQPVGCMGVLADLSCSTGHLNARSSQ
jgi:hypothetical protein